MYGSIVRIRTFSRTEIRGSFDSYQRTFNARSMERLTAQWHPLTGCSKWFCSCRKDNYSRSSSIGPCKFQRNRHTSQPSQNISNMVSQLSQFLHPKEIWEARATAQTFSAWEGGPDSSTRGKVLFRDSGGLQGSEDMGSAWCTEKDTALNLGTATSHNVWPTVKPLSKLMFCDYNHLQLTCTTSHTNRAFEIQKNLQKMIPKGKTINLRALDCGCEYKALVQKDQKTDQPALFSNMASNVMACYGRRPYKTFELFGKLSLWTLLMFFALNRLNSQSAKRSRPGPRLNTRTICPCLYRDRITCSILGKVTLSQRWNNMRQRHPSPTL